MCPATSPAAAWTITTEGDSPAMSVDLGTHAGRASFALTEMASGRVIEGRLRSTWRHEICEIFRHDDLAASISTSLLRDIRAWFVGDVPGPDTLQVRGDFVEQNYRFFRCTRTVAVVSTLWDDPRRGLGVEVRPCEDQAMILAAVLAIRCLCGEPERAAVFGLPRLRHGRTPALSRVRATG
jgi:hypothetical protein